MTKTLTFFFFCPRHYRESFSFPSLVLIVTREKLNVYLDVYVAENANASDSCVFDSGNESHFYVCAFFCHFQACF